VLIARRNGSGKSVDCRPLVLIARRNGSGKSVDCRFSAEPVKWTACTATVHHFVVPARHCVMQAATVHPVQTIKQHCS